MGTKIAFGCGAALLLALALVFFTPLGMILVFATAEHGQTVTVGRDGCDTVALAFSRRRGVFGARHEQIASHTGEWAPEGILPEVELLPPPRSIGVQRVRLGGLYDTHKSLRCETAPVGVVCAVAFPSDEVKLTIYFDADTADPNSRAVEIMRHITSNVLCRPNTPVAP
jgi:hypothetical protein